MKYTMNKDELGKLVIISGTAGGACAVKEAARRLHLSGRQIKQLKKQFREQGEGAVIHVNTGKQSANWRGTAKQDHRAEKNSLV
jgi:hypothetical protein